MTLRADSPCVGACVAAVNHEPRRFGRRPDMLVLHYTGMRTASGAVDWLTRAESRVSCHYAVDEHGLVTQMVAEDLRAWHAGVSHWAGEEDINSCSIGIEIHNPGHQIDYREFPPEQMSAVEALCVDIVRRNRIPPGRVLGHSDVAPLRKDDPGEKFDWRRLSRSGVGVWVEPAPLAGDLGLVPGTCGEDVRAVQERLRRIGYGITTTGQYDEPTRRVVLAFQRHWRQGRTDGHADSSTLITLSRLEAALGVDCGSTRP